MRFRKPDNPLTVARRDGLGKYPAGDRPFGPPFKGRGALASGPRQYHTPARTRNVSEGFNQGCSER